MKTLLLIDLECVQTGIAWMQIISLETPKYDYKTGLEIVNACSYEF